MILFPRIACAALFYALMACDSASPPPEHPRAQQAARHRPQDTDALPDTAQTRPANEQHCNSVADVTVALDGNVLNFTLTCDKAPVTGAAITVHSLFGMLSDTSDEQGHAKIDLSKGRPEPELAPTMSVAATRATVACSSACRLSVAGDLPCAPIHQGEPPARNALCPRPHDIDISASPLYVQWLAANGSGPTDAQKRAALEKEKTDCAAGVVRGCSLAAMHSDNRAEQLGFWRRGCSLGNQSDCSMARDFDPSNVQTSSSSSTASADASVIATDLRALGTRCKNGENSACAVMNFATQCQQGLSSGCDSVGNAYVGGVGVTRDLNRAKTYWLKACQSASTRCAAYGIKFYNTTSFPDHERTAQAFFDMACQGDAEQCVVVGTLFLRGTGGIPRDQQKAHDYFDRGCKAGVAASCQSLQLR